MPEYDIVVLSHLRWGFVHQRPQHLLTRAAADHRVFFVEEPVETDGSPRLAYESMADGVLAAVPHVPRGLDPETSECVQRDLIRAMLAEYHVEDFVVWFYTPMAVALARDLKPLATVYDCMDELSAFAGAPVVLRDREGELYDSADLVFTGGPSLYRSKRARHPHVHLFPSSVDLDHFSQARQVRPEPADQRAIPAPRAGFFGVIDERLDRELLREVADLRPDVSFVMVGPVVKIDEATLPQAPNIHYLGSKSYDELPDYLAGWSVALLPFAHNESTRFISPTKTPEYLAGGVPVVSTSIRDVVDPYGKRGLVAIADTAEAFAAALDGAIAADRASLIAEVDAFLANQSWDRTWRSMRSLIDSVVERRRGESAVASIIVPPSPTDSMTDARTEGGYVAEPTSLRVQVSDRGFDDLVVGAGFAGSVLAERLAREAGRRVLLIDQRPHVAGNAFDHYDDAGVMVHRYGPHIFHTNAMPVVEYLSQFTQWRPYEHRVLANVDGQLVPIPINLDTINTLYGTSMNALEVEEFLATLREPIEHPRTSEEVVLKAVGRELYEKFFRNYTRKQWGLDPSELDAAVTARVPTRTNRDPRYFTDAFQAMPLHGYTRMFERMLDHPNIKVMLNTSYREVERLAPYRQVFYTGPIDEFFGYRFGKLPYRSLEFRFETHDMPVYQPAPVVNYPNHQPYTRITEFKYLTGQEHPRTSIVYEYPRAEGDPYYPIPRPDNAELYRKYKALAERTPGVHFVGRLATYRYYNMDQVVAQALAVFRRLHGVAVRNGKESDGLDGAILSPTRDVGGGRMHEEPRRGPFIRPVAADGP